MALSLILSKTFKYHAGSFKKRLHQIYIKLLKFIANFVIIYLLYSYFYYKYIACNVNNMV